MKFGLAMLIAVMVTSPTSALDVLPINTDGPGVNLTAGSVFDILGLQPGTTLDEARRIIGELSTRGPEETGVRGTLRRAGAGTVDVDFVQEIRTTDDVRGNYFTDGFDRLRVVVASKLYDQRVLMVRRDVMYPSGTALTARDLHDQIVAKYGEPSIVQSNSSGWPTRIVYAYGPDGRYQELGGTGWGRLASDVKDYQISGYHSTDAPCQMALAAAQLIAEAEVSDRASVVYDDADCVAALEIELTHNEGFMTGARFTSIDQKRALDYGKALVETIDQALSSTKSLVPQQNL